MSYVRLDALDRKSIVMLEYRQVRMATNPNVNSMIPEHIVNRRGLNWITNGCSSAMTLSSRSRINDQQIGK